MAAIDDLRQWFETELKLADWDQNVKVDTSDPDATAVHFYTDVNEYVLTITEESDGPFIAAIVKSRKPRAGQDVPRSRRIPLSAGPTPLTQRAWRRVLNSIVAIEMVRVQRKESFESVAEAREGAGRAGRVGASAH